MEVKTKLGILDGVVSTSSYEDGTVKDCILDKANIVFTECGALVPQFGEENVRRRYTKSISFYPSGDVKSIVLEKQSDIMTPIGEFPAEMVSFYETGELKRFFPVNGKISGYWSEKDEAELNIPFQFSFEFGDFTAMLVGMCFYRSGRIRSLTLYPGEVVQLNTPAGAMSVRNGFSLYESGALESAEPESPLQLSTPIGVLNAYNPNACGVNADKNSLVFNEDGTIRALTTSSDAIAVYDEKRTVHFITPVKEDEPDDEEETAMIPVKIEFSEDAVVFITDEARKFKISSSKFTVMKSNFSCSSGCSDCSSCNLCK